MKYLILGNGAAGSSAADKLRELDPNGEITVASSENTAAYAKIMLPDYIGGKIAREKLILRDEAYYRKNEIKLLLRHGIERIDTAKKCVAFKNGKTECYDKLLLTLGGVPFIPPIGGLEEAEYFTINSLSDADSILQKAVSGRTALICGGGLTGIEMAFALRRGGMKVILTEREGNILPVQLDSEPSGIMIRWLEKEGIRVLTGLTVKEVRNTLALLSDGQEVAFDMLVLAIGTRSNIQPLNNTPIGCRRGVLVDEYLQTSVEDVYAAGDVAEITENIPGGYVSCYIWPNAMAQGKCAAFNMTGQMNKFSFEAGKQSMVQLRDIPFVSMGLVRPEGEGYETLVHADREKGIYRKVILKDAVVIGATFIGDTRTANVITGFIRKSLNVAEYKSRLLDADLGTANK